MSGGALLTAKTYKMPAPFWLPGSTKASDFLTPSPRSRHTRGGCSTS
jgi:hypothetical protein